MSYVITCGDEGVQINEGTRLAIVGAGTHFEEATQIIDALKEQLGELQIAASGQNDWTKQQLKLADWEQTDASMQQHVQVLAEQNGVNYAGFLPFADPKELDFDIKGHMVRPRGIHIANTACFTLDGGEQKYHLGQYLISAEWVSQVDVDLAKTAITKQLEFYTELNRGNELRLTYQTGGELGSTVAEENKAVLESFGLKIEPAAE